MLTLQEMIDAESHKKAIKDKSAGSSMSALLCATLSVEHDHVVLRDSGGWLLWSMKITSETSLDEMLEQAKNNLGYKQGT